MVIALSGCASRPRVQRAHADANPTRVVDVRDYGALGRPLVTRGSIRAGTRALQLRRGGAMAWLPESTAPLPPTWRPGIGVAGADLADGATPIPLLSRVVAIDPVTDILTLRDAASRDVIDAVIHADDRPPFQDALDVPLGAAARRRVRVPAGVYVLGVPGAVAVDAGRPGNLPLFLRSHTELNGDAPDADHPERWPLIQLADDVAQVAPGAPHYGRCVGANAVMFMNEHNGFWYSWLTWGPAAEGGPKLAYELPARPAEDIEIGFLRLDGNRGGQRFATAGGRSELWRGADIDGFAAALRRTPRVAGAPPSTTALAPGKYWVGLTYRNAAAESSLAGPLQIEVTREAAASSDIVIDVVLPSRPPVSAPTPVLYFKKYDATSNDCPPRYARIIGDPPPRLTRADFAVPASHAAPGQLSVDANAGVASGLHFDNLIHARVHDLRIEDFALEGVGVAGGASPNPRNPRLARFNVIDCRLDRVVMRRNGRQGLGVSGRVDQLAFNRCTFEENESGGCDIEPTIPGRVVGLAPGTRTPIFEAGRQSLGSIEFRDCVFRHHRNPTTYALAIQPSWGTEIQDVSVIGCGFEDNHGHLTIGQGYTCDPNRVASAGACVAVNALASPTSQAAPLPPLDAYDPPRATVRVVGSTFRDSAGIACRILTGEVLFQSCQFQDNNHRSALPLPTPADVLIQGNTSAPPAVRFEGCAFRRWQRRHRFAQRSQDLGSIQVGRGVGSVRVEGGTLDGQAPGSGEPGPVFLHRGEGAIEATILPAPPAAR